MNSSSEKLPFDPHLKLLAQSLVEFRTGFSENDYLEVVGEIARNLNLSYTPNCLLLAKKDLSRHLLRYLLEFYQQHAKILSVNADFFSDRHKEIFSLLNGFLANTYISQNGRIVAASALGNIDQSDESVVNALFAVVNENDDNIRWAIESALENIKQLNGLGIMTLLSALKDGKVNTTSAIKNLKKTDKHGLEVLLTALQDSNWIIRKTAISALGSLGLIDERVIVALLKALKDVECFVIEAAVLALGNLGYRDERIIKALLSVLNDDKWLVREAAVTALGNLGFTNEDIITALFTVLKDRSWHVRGATVFTLGKLMPDDERVIIALLSTIKDNEWYVRYATVLALTKITQPNERVISALFTALRDSDKDVWQTAAVALGEISQNDEHIDSILIDTLNDKSVYHFAGAPKPPCGMNRRTNDSFRNRCKISKIDPSHCFS